MRLLLTTDTIGGVWTFTREVCSGLLERGHSVSLVSLGAKACASQFDWTQRISEAHAGNFDFTALNCPLEWMPKNERAFDGAAKDLLRIADDFGADLLHLNQFCFGALAFAGPKVVTAHSDVLSWGEACQPEGFSDTPWLERYRAFVTSGLLAAHAVVAPTAWMAGALRRNFSEAGEVLIIPNGRTLPPNTKPLQRSPRAVTAGRLWDKAKGLVMLEELGTSIPIHLAGSTRVAGCEGEGGLAEEDLLDLFRSSSVYVACSIYEPFGLAGIEAALCGCSIVANDIPSLREVWGEGALFFNCKEELAWILDRLQSNRDELRQAQQRSHGRALQFPASQMVDRYEALYHRLLASPETSSAKERMVYAG